MTDGFGQRIVTEDPASGDTVQVLSFNPTLVAHPDFGRAIGERVARVARVRHMNYARVRRVERPAPDTLLLYSDDVPGWRLRDVLVQLQDDSAGLEVSAVLVLLRQLIAAAVLFSRHQRDAAIGTLAPERVILTPHGRVVIAEYVLAPGVEMLQSSRERLWRELRVALPSTAQPNKLLPTADVTAVGVIALSLLLGRPLQDDEFLVSLGDLAARLTERSGTNVRRLSPTFHEWLSRTLQFDEAAAFRSLPDAQVAFEEMLAQERAYVTSPAELEIFLARLSTALPMTGVAVSTGVPPGSKGNGATAFVAPSPQDTPVVESLAAVQVEGPSTKHAAAAAALGEFASEGKDADAPDDETAIAMKASVEPAHVPSAPTPRARRPTWIGAAAAVLALTALAQGAFIAWVLTRPPSSAGLNGELVVQSHPPAARVTVDGEDHGVTPLATPLSPGAHIVEVRVGRAEPRVIPVLVRGGVQSSLYVELQSVATVGGLEVRSDPANAQVSVAGRFRGITPLTVRDLPPGEVEVAIKSGVREVRQTVRIEPGITNQLIVPMGR